MSGTAGITCQADGTWTATPTCDPAGKYQLLLGGNQVYEILQNTNIVGLVLLRTKNASLYGHLTFSTWRTYECVKLQRKTYGSYSTDNLFILASNTYFTQILICVLNMPFQTAVL